MFGSPLTRYLARINGELSDVTFAFPKDPPLSFNVIEQNPVYGPFKLINQCDGCRVNAPLSPRGNHYMPDGGFMGCTKDLYTVSSGTQSSDQDEKKT